MVFYYLSFLLDVGVNMGDIPHPTDTSNESIALYIVIMIFIGSLVMNYFTGRNTLTDFKTVAKEFKDRVYSIDKLITHLPNIEKHEEKHEDFLWVHKQVYDWETATKALKELKDKYDKEKQEADRLAKAKEEKEWESRMQSLMQVVENFQKENLRKFEEGEKRMGKIEKTFEDFNFKKLNSLAENLEILVGKLNGKV